MHTPSRFILLTLGAIAFAFAPALQAKVTPASLFVDHAVLQQGREIPVWGTANPGEKITVKIGQQSKTTTAAPDGRWSVKLAALPAGGPYSLTLQGEDTITLQDILVGEVWICSGQSNMERQLGPRPPQKPILGWEQAVATANFPQIRHFGAAQTTAASPQAQVRGEWLVCSPETAAKFTAVGFFFGRALYAARHVPIGLIHSSWGGTVAEAWMSRAALQPFPQFAQALTQVESRASDPAGAARSYTQALDAWYHQADEGTKQSPVWSSPDLTTGDWSEMKLPTNWEDAGLPGLDGVVWFRKTIDLPESWEKAIATLNLGPIDDIDTTWVNGVPVGTTNLWNASRHYALPPGTLKAGKNVIAIRVLDTAGNGGVWATAST